MDSKKVLYFGLGIGAALLYIKYMNDRKLKAEDIKNKEVKPTTPMNSTTAATNPSQGIVATTTEKIKQAFGEGAMTINDLTKGRKNIGLGAGGIKQQDVTLREYKGADGVATSQVNDYTSISKACKCSDKTKTHQLGILQNFNR
jgi:hypothetical protein